MESLTLYLVFFSAVFALLGVYMSRHEYKYDYEVLDPEGYCNSQCIKATYEVHTLVDPDVGLSESGQRACVRGCMDQNACVTQARPTVAPDLGDACLQRCYDGCRGQFGFTRRLVRMCAYGCDARINRMPSKTIQDKIDTSNHPHHHHNHYQDGTVPPELFKQIMKVLNNDKDDTEHTSEVLPADIIEGGMKTSVKQDLDVVAQRDVVALADVVAEADVVAQEDVVAQANVVARAVEGIEAARAEHLGSMGAEMEVLVEDGPLLFSTAGSEAAIDETIMAGAEAAVEEVLEGNLVADIMFILEDDWENDYEGKWDDVNKHFDDDADRAINDDLVDELSNDNPSDDSVNDISINNLSDDSLDDLSNDNQSNDFSDSVDSDDSFDSVESDNFLDGVNLSDDSLNYMQPESHSTVYDLKTKLNAMTGDRYDPGYLGYDTKGTQKIVDGINDPYTGGFDYNVAEDGLLDSNPDFYENCCEEYFQNVLESDFDDYEDRNDYLENIRETHTTNGQSQRDHRVVNGDFEKSTDTKLKNELQQSQRDHRVVNDDYEKSTDTKPKNEHQQSQRDHRVVNDDYEKSTDTKPKNEHQQSDHGLESADHQYIVITDQQLQSDWDVNDDPLNYMENIPDTMMKNAQQQRDNTPKTDKHKKDGDIKDDSRDYRETTAATKMKSAPQQRDRQVELNKMQKTAHPMDHHTIRNLSLTLEGNVSLTRNKTQQGHLSTANSANTNPTNLANTDHAKNISDTTEREHVSMNLTAKIILVESHQFTSPLAQNLTPIVTERDMESPYTNVDAVRGMDATKPTKEKEDLRKMDTAKTTKEEEVRGKDTTQAAKKEEVVRDMEKEMTKPSEEQFVKGGGLSVFDTAQMAREKAMQSMDTSQSAKEGRIARDAEATLTAKEREVLRSMEKRQSSEDGLVVKDLDPITTQATKEKGDLRNTETLQTAKGEDRSIDTRQTAEGVVLGFMDTFTTQTAGGKGNLRDMDTSQTGKAVTREEVRKTNKRKDTPEGVDTINTGEQRRVDVQHESMETGTKRVPAVRIEGTIMIRGQGGVVKRQLGQGRAGGVDKATRDKEGVAERIQTKTDKHRGMGTTETDQVVVTGMESTNSDNERVVKGAERTTAKERVTVREVKRKTGKQGVVTAKDTKEIGVKAKTGEKGGIGRGGKRRTCNKGVVNGRTCKKGVVKGLETAEATKYVGGTHKDIGTAVYKPRPGEPQSISIGRLTKGVQSGTSGTVIGSNILHMVEMEPEETKIESQGKEIENKQRTSEDSRMKASKESKPKISLDSTGKKVVKINKEMRPKTNKESGQSSQDSTPQIFTKPRTKEIGNTQGISQDKRQKISKDNPAEIILKSQTEDKEDRQQVNKENKRMTSRDNTAQKVTTQVESQYEVRNEAQAQEEVQKLFAREDMGNKKSDAQESIEIERTYFPVHTTNAKGAMNSVTENSPQKDHLTKKAEEIKLQKEKWESQEAKENVVKVHHSGHDTSTKDVVKEKENVNAEKGQSIDKDEGQTVEKKRDGVNEIKVKLPIKDDIKLNTDKDNSVPVKRLTIKEEVVQDADKKRFNVRNYKLPIKDDLKPTTQKEHTLYEKMPTINQEMKNKVDTKEAELTNMTLAIKNDNKFNTHKEHTLLEKMHTVIKTVEQASEKNNEVTDTKAKPNTKAEIKLITPIKSTELKKVEQTSEKMIGEEVTDMRVKLTAEDKLKPIAQKENTKPIKMTLPITREEVLEKAEKNRIDETKTKRATQKEINPVARKEIIPKERGLSHIEKVLQEAENRKYIGVPDTKWKLAIKDILQKQSIIPEEEKRLSVIEGVLHEAEKKRIEEANRVWKEGYRQSGQEEFIDEQVKEREKELNSALGAVEHLNFVNM